MDKKSKRGSNLRACRQKKRKFRGNRFTCQSDTTFTNASAANQKKTGDEEVIIENNKQSSDQVAMDAKISFVKDHIKSYPDFPKKGILYQDIFSAFAVGKVCKTLNEVLIQYVKESFPEVEAIVGLESRGFFFSFSIAAELEVACVPIRKKGKLPGAVESRSYKLEYGSDIIEVQKNAFKKPKTKCLLIDDLLATGGTMEAAVELLKECQCDIIGCLTIIELADLHGRDKLSNIAVHSLIKF